MNTKKIFNDSVKERLKKYAPIILSVNDVMLLLSSSLIVNSKHIQATNYSYRDLERAYKRFRRRAVSNNYLKMHHEPMRRRWGS